MRAKFGSTVNVHYKGTLSDGTEFDNSRQRGEPLKFEVGSGYMISGFNNAVNGMTVGEVKSVQLEGNITQRLFKLCREVHLPLTLSSF